MIPPVLPCFPSPRPAPACSPRPHLRRPHSPFPSPSPIPPLSSSASPALQPPPVPPNPCPNLLPAPGAAPPPPVPPSSPSRHSPGLTSVSTRGPSLPDTLLRPLPPLVSPPAPYSPTSLSVLPTRRRASRLALPSPPRAGFQSIPLVSLAPPPAGPPLQSPRSPEASASPLGGSPPSSPLPCCLPYPPPPPGRLPRCIGSPRPTSAAPPLPITVSSYPRRPLPALSPPRPPASSP
ncbi:hypothetical protein CgunFtcFv8_010156 [Champsocephalus gunnari]|uniref:Uncharacterized protein n=1 Tax=Champsocephalus gunnari TaxID=52237 RepID=A0AAN8DTC1_CHAGU|nr:hypothetical protein CgunFtcFv8_010156 [Champsocephalus gunnari]